MLKPFPNCPKTALPIRRGCTGSYSTEEIDGTYERDVDFYVIEINLRAADKSSGLSRLQDIGVTLQLDPGDIALLKSFGRIQLEKSAEWQRLMRDIGTASKLRQEK